MRSNGGVVWKFEKKIKEKKLKKRKKKKEKRKKFFLVKQKKYTYIYLGIFLELLQSV